MVLRLLCWLLIVCRVVWSRRQPLASVGAVLGLLDGPTGCDPVFCVVWFRFRLFRRFLALWPSQVGRAYRLLERVCEGCPALVMVLFTFSLLVLLRLVSGGIPLLWLGLGLVYYLCSVIWLVPVQHFRSAILDAWRGKVAADLCAREGLPRRSSFWISTCSLAPRWCC